MMYRFKGTNGSMGLTTGNKYQISLEEEDGKIFANVFLTTEMVMVGRQKYAGGKLPTSFMPYVFVPYDSMAKFEENWSKAGECRCTNPGKDDGQTTCWEHHDCNDGSCTHQE